MRFPRLPLKTQLALMGIIPLLLIVYLTIYLYREQDRKSSLLKGYIDRIVLTSNVSHLIYELQEERRSSFDLLMTRMKDPDLDIRRKKADSIINKIKQTNDPRYQGFETYTGIEKLDSIRKAVDSNSIATNSLMHYFSNMIFRLNSQNSVPYGTYTYLVPVAKELTSHKILSDILTYLSIIRANFYNVLVTRQYPVETLAGTVGTFDVLKSYEKELQFKSSNSTLRSFENVVASKNYTDMRNYIDRTFKTFTFDSSFTAEEWWQTSGYGFAALQNLQDAEWRTITSSMDDIYNSELRTQNRTLISMVIVLVFLVGLIAFIYYFISRDTMRLKSMVAVRTEELNRSNIELQRSNKELEEFAFVASHDLQEPLRKIQTFSDIIQKNIDDKQVTLKYLEKLSMASKRMSDLISSVLNYSKLRSDTDAFEKLDLNSLLTSVKEDLELMINEKKAIIYSDKLPVIRGIPAQLYQLFYNILHNSLKFSKDKPIVNIHSRMNVRVPPDANLDPHYRYCEITMIDNGIGFDPEFKDQIFAIFQRLHSTYTYQGTGIGLALCKKIVENHGGHIRAESQEGKGARFIILLRQ